MATRPVCAECAVLRAELRVLRAENALLSEALPRPPPDIVNFQAAKFAPAWALMLTICPRSVYTELDTLATELKAGLTELRDTAVDIVSAWVGLHVASRWHGEGCVGALAAPQVFLLIALRAALCSLPCARCGGARCAGARVPFNDFG